MEMERTSTSPGVPKSKHANQNKPQESLLSHPPPSGEQVTPNTESTQKSAFQPYVPVLSSNKRKREPQNKLQDESPEPVVTNPATPIAPAHEKDRRRSSANEQEGRDRKKGWKKEKKQRLEHNADAEREGQSERMSSVAETRWPTKNLKADVTGYESETLAAPVSEDLQKKFQVQGKERDGNKKEKKEKKKNKKATSTTEIDSNTDPCDTHIVCEEHQLPKGTKSRSQIDDDAKGGVEPPDDAAFEPSAQSDDQRKQLRRRSNITSDNEWLRAKTSRVLDLMDDIPPSAKPRSELEERGNETPAYQKVKNTEKLGLSSVNSSATSTRHSISSAGRLFVRNLPYTATETEIESVFSKYGRLNEVRFAALALYYFRDDYLIGTTDASQLILFHTEYFSRYLFYLIRHTLLLLSLRSPIAANDRQVHLVRDKAGKSKGIGYIQFADRDRADHALQALDGKSFQGRLLHILKAAEKKSHKLDDFETSKLSLKKQKALKRKSEGAESTFNWNSMYMNANAVLSSVADRLGVTKAELMDASSAEAAVKQAHAETHVIQETKAFLATEGVNLDAFRQRERDQTIVLVKNFPFGTTGDELKSLFGPYGEIVKFLLPPSGTIAIVQYAQPGEGSQAMRHLAYRNLKGSILYLEIGPRDLFNESAQSVANSKTSDDAPGSNQGDRRTSRIGEPSSSTLFVRNLNFATTTSGLTHAFKPLSGFLSATVKTKIDPKRPQEVLSMGFGFVEFGNNHQALAALAAMKGHRLDDHELLVEVSRKANDTAEEQRQQSNTKKAEAHKTKIIIKNLPFEATKKDVRALLGAYGQLRSVKVPKKFDHSTRGFAFADFVTAKEAENTMEALKDTHLLGRRLVLEFAEEETVDPEAEIRAIESKVGRQTEIIQLKKMTGSTRKRFNVGAQDDDQ